MTWYSVRVEAVAHREEALAALFAAGAQGVHEDGAALVTSFAGESEARAAGAAAVAADPAATIDIRPSPAVDWATAWRDHARVVSLGRLSIAPPWLAGGLDPSATVVIEPGMAFGTGDHGSTRGAARLLEVAVRPGLSVADLGSGSAVLSIVAARLGAAPVWAIENDPEAQPNARENVARNGVTGTVHLLDGDAAVMLPLVAPVQVIAVNIISSVIASLLPAMADALAPGGRAILAGILANESGDMTERLTRTGWTIRTSVVEDDWWSALVERR